MKVIYCCYGSSHSSVIAAAIHLGWLPCDRVPGAEEIERVPHYDRTDPQDIGTCYFMGTDEAGTDVYIMGMGAAKGVVRRAVCSVFRICGVPDTEYLLVDTLHDVGIITKAGGFLSRALGLVAIGRPMSIWGIRRSYPRFVRLVSGVRASLARRGRRAGADAAGNGPGRGTSGD